MKQLPLGHGVNVNELEEDPQRFLRIIGASGNPLVFDEAEATTYVATLAEDNGRHAEPVDVYLDGSAERWARIRPGQWAAVPGVCQLVNGSAMVIHRPGYRRPWATGDSEMAPNIMDPSVLMDPAPLVGFGDFSSLQRRVITEGEELSVAALLVLGGDGTLTTEESGLDLVPGVIAYAPEGSKPVYIEPEDHLDLVVFVEGSERGVI